MLHTTQNVQSPALYTGILITKALEGDSHFDLVAAVDESSLRLEEVIGIEIDASFQRIDVAKAAAGGRWPAGSARKLCAPRSVLLDSVRIHSKQKRDLPGVVGVEQNLDLVFAVNIVAIGVRRSHDVAVNLARSDTEVDRVRCVPGQHFGRLDGR